MPEAELFLLFVRPLNRAGMRYVVTGSIAAIFYGEPRLTHDVDLVVFLNDANIQALPQLFPGPDFYLPPPDAIFAEVRNRSIAAPSMNGSSVSDCKRNGGWFPPELNGSLIGDNALR